MIRTAVLSLCTALFALSCRTSDVVHGSLTSQQTENLISCADSFLKKGKVDSARVLYSVIENGKANDVRARIGLGRVALAERDWSKALGLAKQVMKKDTTNIPSHYVAALAYREMGTGMMSRNTDWQSSRRHFEWILHRDSSFEDALYQYAVLERYDGNRDHALELARAQVTKRPELVGPQLGLYKLYRYYMAVQDPAEFIGWLRNQPGNIPRYFVGETLRREGKIAAAESLLTGLLHVPGEVSTQAIRLALARLRQKQGDGLAAEAEYSGAVRDLRTELGSAILFEDLKYIVSDGELDYYNSLDSVNGKRDFFRSFWNFRNPSFALGTNPRLREHIRRYLFAEDHYDYVGFRTRFNDPDLLRELKFPRAFALNEEFNDMGLIYIRHGEPDDVLRANITPFDNEDELFNPNAAPHMRQPGSATREGRELDEENRERLWEGLRTSSTQQDPCESWLYNATDETSKMIFNFQKHNTAGNNWRFSPSPSNETMIDDLTLWDVRYYRLGNERNIDRAVVEGQIKAESRAIVDYALSTEKQTWEKKTETFRFPHAIDLFRAPDGRTLLDVSYAIPLASISRDLPDSVKSIPVEIGFSLVDANSHHATSQRDTMQVGFTRARVGAVIDLIRYTVPPDSYAVSMHIRPLGTNKLGTWRQTLSVRDFSRPDFMMSSIQFLRPSTEKGALAIEGVRVVQSPLRTQVRTEPFFIYFQIYHLVPDASGNTSYRTECVLLPEGEQDAGKGIIVHRKEKTGKEEMAAEFSQIDLHAVDPGRYRLIVNVTDRKRVQTVSAERELEILKP
jgi:hypothetical protein